MIRLQCTLEEYSFKNIFGLLVKNSHDHPDILAQHRLAAGYVEALVFAVEQGNPIYDLRWYLLCWITRMLPPMTHLAAGITAISNYCRAFH
jgi:hypothetical protein